MSMFSDFSPLLARRGNSTSSSSNDDDSSQTANLTEKSWLLLNTDMPTYVHKESIVAYCMSTLTDPNLRPYRYLIAILVSMIDGINFFCADFPAGIQSTIIKVMDLDNTHYNMFFSAYTWPDIVMSILGTVLIDKCIGMRKGLVIFTSIVFIGQSLVSVGAYTNSFPVMIVGRILMGCGNGTVISTTSSFIVIWFLNGSEIVFVFAIARCLHRLFATLALVTPQFLYDFLNTYIHSSPAKHGTTQMMCTCLCFIAVLFAILVALLDTRGAKFVGRKPIKKKIRVIDILSFSMSYWIIMFSCSLFFTVIVSFTCNAPLFYISKFKMTKDIANIANCISYLGMIFITPFVGMLIDHVGYNLIWGIAGVLFAMLSNIVTLTCTEVDWYAPYTGALLYSMAFTFFGTSMWVTVGYLVAKHQLTTAYGLMSSGFAINSTIINLSFGVIIDSFGYLMLGVSCIVFLFSIVLLFVFLSFYEVVSKKRLLNVYGKSRKQ